MALRIHFDMNGNENITYQNLWNSAKAVPRGNFKAIDAYNKKCKTLHTLKPKPEAVI